MKPAVCFQTKHQQLVGALVSAYVLRRNSRFAVVIDPDVFAVGDIYELLREEMQKNHLRHDALEV